MRTYSSDLDKTKSHSGPCWPSEPCARCMGYPESEILEIEKSRQKPGHTLGCAFRKHLTMTNKCTCKDGG